MKDGMKVWMMVGMKLMIKIWMLERRLGCCNEGWDVGKKVGMLGRRLGCWEEGWDVLLKIEMRVGGCCN